ncbi:MAG TPA: hypothetical protein VEO54_24090 [Thermoanaerobaculia bacterium]|nr:hypothetical protein [Thermoanaerobaculia bacterium]
MNETNRRRLLAGTCAAVMSATLLYAVAGRAATSSSTPAHADIAVTGFLAVLHVGLTAGAVFGITQLVRRHADRLGLTGAALTLLGATVGARIMVLVQLRALSEHDPIALLRTVPMVWVSVIPIGLMYPIGLIVLGIALFRSRYRTIGVLLAIGGFFFPLGRAIGIVPALYLSDGLLAIAYAWLAKEMLTAWEAPEGRAEAHPTSSAVRA